MAQKNNIPKMYIFTKCLQIQRKKKKKDKKKCKKRKKKVNEN